MTKKEKSFGPTIFDDSKEETRIVQTEKTYEDHPAATLMALRDQLHYAKLEAERSGNVGRFVIDALRHVCQELGDAMAYGRPTIARDEFIGRAVLKAYEELVNRGKQ